MNHATNTEAERAAFDEWFNKGDHNGSAWEVWQAARATQASAEPVEKWKVCGVCMGRGERDIAHGVTEPCATCSGKGACLAAPSSAPSTEPAGRTQEDADEDFALIQKLSKILAGVAVALNGPEPELTRWSYHDLAEKAQVMALELDLYKTIYGDKVPEGWEDGTAPERAPSTDSAGEAQ